MTYSIKMIKYIILLISVYLGYSFINRYKQIHRSNICLFEDNFKVNQGIDMRFKDDNYMNDSILMNIEDYILKKKILENLIDKDISISQKLDLINYNYILDNNLCPNILSGGLLDDYNFNI